MAGIQFVTWDGGGNLPPTLGIARELQRRGHAVGVIGEESQRSCRLFRRSVLYTVVPPALE